MELVVLYGTSSVGTCNTALTL